MKYIFYPIAILLLVLTSMEFFPVLTYAIKHLATYQWLLYGVAAYFVLRRFKFFALNEKWMLTASHETNHIVVGLMFFHKIHSLQVNENSGVVYHSGNKFGDIFISLAPYCLPLVTYLLLLLRLIGAHEMLYVFDLLIGFTLGFYIFSFYKETHLYQTDILKHGYVKSFMFLFICWFFNATIILLSVRKGIFGAVTYLFPEYWDNIVGWWNFIF